MNNEKPSKYYLLADSHFGHKRIITDFGFRPANFDELIIKRWQHVVTENDVVFHLGDVTWGTKDQLSTIMNQLPGTKILIRGNHDRNHSNNWFIKTGFAAVLEKAQVCGAVLSHMPVALTQEELDRGIINVHGHFHNNSAERWEKRFTDRFTDNHYLLALENVDYTPVPLELVLKRRFVQSSKRLFEKCKIKQKAGI